MGLFSKFFTVGGSTLISRVLGFVREMLIASLLGAGPVADAFYAAFRFPNLFRRLFAEGAFNSAFVPMFSKELEDKGAEQAKSFAEQVLSYLVIILLILTILAELMMPYLVGTIIAPKFSSDPGKFSLTVELTRIMFPYLFCMSMVAMLSGILNSLRNYFFAAIVPVLLNIVLIAGLLIAYQFGLEEITVGRILGWGVLLAGLLQAMLLYWAASGRGFALRFHLPRPSQKVRRLLKLALPLALTGGITQINLLVGQIIASAQDGAIAILNFADRVYQLPLGVVGIAIGVVLLPELTRALTSSDEGEVQKLQNRSLEFAIMLTLPASIGLFFLAEPVVQVLYERGAFTAQTTLLTAQALAAFSIGLPSFVLQKVFQPTYFARFDMKAPMWFAAISALVNIVGSLLLFPQYGHVGIAIATSLAGWVNALLLIVGLLYNKHFHFARVSIINLAKIVLASIVMGILLYVSMDAFMQWITPGNLLVRIMLLGMLIGLCVVVYFSILFLSGAIGFRQLLGMFRKRA